MRAFIIDRYGKGGGRIGTMPDPVLRDDDVLVRTGRFRDRRAKGQVVVKLR